MGKSGIPRVYEPGEDTVHIAPPPRADQVTLCGLTDWIGVEPGVKTDKPLTCRACRDIIQFCQSLPRLV